MHDIDQKKVLYRIIIWCLLIVSAYALYRITPTLFRTNLLPGDDYVTFWASGRLNINRENPLDPERIEQLNIALGGEPSSTMKRSIMLNPPWTLALLIPFAYLDYPISRILWLIFSIVLILISSSLLWRMYSGNPKQRWLAYLVVFIFAPTISMLEKGQIDALVLLGLTGFLYFTMINRNDWLAGTFLALASIKPQIVYIFWIALIFWIIQERRWVLIITTAIPVMILSLLTYLFNPTILQHYLNMLSTNNVSDWANPTIGAYLRFFWFGIENFWVQFFPSILGCLWFIIIWIKRHHSWNWLDELPLIVIISQVTTPYAWTYDQVILVPVILQATVWITYDWKRWLTLFVAIYYMTVNILDLLMHQNLSDFWFLWLAPAYIILYLIIRWQYKKKADPYILAQLAI